VDIREREAHFRKKLDKAIDSSFTTNSRKQIRVVHRLWGLGCLLKLYKLNQLFGGIDCS